MSMNNTLLLSSGTRIQRAVAVLLGATCALFTLAVSAGRAEAAVDAFISNDGVLTVMGDDALAT